ncbi:protein NO VEIN domain-containing protein [Treponema sp. R6D11]
MSKFDMDFVKLYGFRTKNAFYEYIVSIGIAQTIGTVKNRQDRFDGMNPESSRKGWWQDGFRNDYKFRKNYIDSFFGNLGVEDFVNVVKMSIAQKFSDNVLDSANINLQKNESNVKTSPLIQSYFKQMQKTGREAECYFLNNYMTIDTFANAKIEDARLFGDGYDFQLSLPTQYFLVEVKGLRNDKGNIRLTEKEYNKACEYKNDYVLVIVKNLLEIPKFISIFNPVQNIEMEKCKITSEQVFFRAVI